MTVDIADRLAGAVWGHLVGDAVGVPYEFKDASAITGVHFGMSGTHGQPPGTWSDDGAMMLALLDSLLRDRADDEAEFDPEDQGKRFLAWADDGAYTPDGDGRFDIGNATSSALARLRRGTPAEQAGGTGERDLGNGSLMRILPIALVDRVSSNETLIERAHRASAVTHGRVVAQVACALYLLIARYLLLGASREGAFLRARGVLDAGYEGDRRRALEEVEAWKGRSGRGYVVDSFWSAWDAFAGARDYRDAIERAIRYGGDTDTTAAIAGGLAGIRFGRSGIPAHWLAKMRGAKIVDPLVARLTAETARPTGRASSQSQIQAEPPPPGTRTSEDSPIRVDWVDPAKVPADAGWTGRLGMTFLPGKHEYGQAGHHWRDLDADVQRLATEHGVQTFVLLVEDHELDRTGTTRIADVMAADGIELLRYPIVDIDVPADPAAFAVFLAQVEDRLRAGRRVVVTCKGGLGRTGTTVGCLLREAGLDADAAVVLTRASRRGTIENPTQEGFVRAWVPSPG